ncbi:MAG: immunoglobulin domain-containing protein [Verrucomicrobia bacterium]|nr:immunoglobulin domain-containing protein [Verrucomicrobiota bacterium]
MSDRRRHLSFLAARLRSFVVAAMSGAMFLFAATPAGAQPIIVTQPQNVNATTGDPVSLTVAATGASLRYQWRLNGANLPGETNGALTLAGAQATNGGRYHAVVFNAAGATNSVAAELVLTNLPMLAFADSFSARPSLGGATNGLGRTNNFAATREPAERTHGGHAGGASLWATWTPTNSGVATFTTRGSGFDTTLAIYEGTNLYALTPVPNAADDDGGGFRTSLVTFNAQSNHEYQIAVDGSFGARGNFVLGWSQEVTSQRVPEILEQPQGKTVALNGTARFGVRVAETSLPVSYQWFLDGVTIDGATNARLVLAGVTSTNVGTYRARVRDPVTGRAAFSDAAFVQINTVGAGGTFAGATAQDKFLMETDQPYWLPPPELASLITNHLYIGPPNISDGDGSYASPRAGTISVLRDLLGGVNARVANSLPNTYYHFLAGTYTTTNRFILKNGTAIGGAGLGLTTIYYATNGADFPFGKTTIFTTGGDFAFVTNALVENLTLVLNGPDNKSGASTISGVHLEGFQCIVRNLEVRRSRGNRNPPAQGEDFVVVANSIGMTPGAQIGGHLIENVTVDESQVDYPDDYNTIMSTGSFMNTRPAARLMSRIVAARVLGRSPTNHNAAYTLEGDTELYGSYASNNYGGVYAELQSNTSLEVVRNSHWRRLIAGVRFVGQGAMTNLQFLNNDIADLPDSGSAGFYFQADTPADSYAELVLANNHVTSTNPGSVQFVGLVRPDRILSGRMVNNRVSTNGGTFFALGSAASLTNYFLGNNRNDNGTAITGLPDTAMNAQATANPHHFGSAVLGTAGAGRGFYGTQIFSTVGAARELDEPSHTGEAGGSSAWFFYTPPVDGPFTVDTAGTVFDHALAVYAGDGESLTGLVLVASSRTNNGPGAESVTFNAGRATNYVIAVEGVAGATGVVTLNYRLDSPPLFLSGLADRGILPGQAATLEVAATGGPPPQYQWRCNGTNLAGATNASLALSNFSFTAEGGYQVVLSNPLGAVTGAVANVRMDTRPVTGFIRDPATGNLVLVLSANVPNDYVLQTSGDLVQWTNFQTNDTVFLVTYRTDTNAGVLPRRFYRLVR